MMDVNDAIAYFDQYLDSPLYTETHKIACKMAIDALRAQQAAEKNDPLTLDELRQMDGQPVWIDDWIEPFNGWELSEDASDYFEGRDVKKYGSAWFAYRRQRRRELNETNPV